MISILLETKIPHTLGFLPSEKISFVFCLGRLTKPIVSGGTVTASKQ